MKLATAFLVGLLPFLFSAQAADDVEDVNSKMTTSVNVVAIFKFYPNQSWSWTEISCPEGYNEMILYLDTMLHTNVLYRSVFSIKSGTTKIVQMNTRNLKTFGSLAKVLPGDSPSLAKIDRSKLIMFK